MASQKQLLTDEQREALREKFTPKINNPDLCAKVLELRQQGKNIDEIRKELKIGTSTAHKILQRYGDPLAESIAILKVKLPQVTQMVMDEVLKSKDRRTGALLLEKVGILEAIRPKEEPKEDGGRIIIEWSGAPPPWAPKSVLEAYAARNLPHTTEPVATCAKVGTDACPPLDVVDVVVEDLPNRVPACQENSNSDTLPANVSSSS